MHSTLFTAKQVKRTQNSETTQRKDSEEEGTRYAYSGTLLYRHSSTADTHYAIPKVQYLSNP